MMRVWTNSDQTLTISCQLQPHWPFQWNPNPPQIYLNSEQSHCGSPVMLGHHFWHQEMTWGPPKTWWKTLRKVDQDPPSGFMMTHVKVISDEHEWSELPHKFRGPSLIGSQLLSWSFLEQDLNIFSYMLGGYLLTSHVGFPNGVLLFSCSVGPNRGCFRCLRTLWEGWRHLDDAANLGKLFSNFAGKTWVQRLFFCFAYIVFRVVIVVISLKTWCFMFWFQKDGPILTHLTCDYIVYFLVLLRPPPTSAGPFSCQPTWSRPKSGYHWGPTCLGWLPVMVGWLFSPVCHWVGWLSVLWGAKGPALVLYLDKKYGNIALWTTRWRRTSNVKKDWCSNSGQEK